MLSTAKSIRSVFKSSGHLFSLSLSLSLALSIYLFPWSSWMISIENNSRRTLWMSNNNGNRQFRWRETTTTRRARRATTTAIRRSTRASIPWSSSKRPAGLLIWRQMFSITPDPFRRQSRHPNSACPTTIESIGKLFIAQVFSCLAAFDQLLRVTWIKHNISDCLGIHF